MSKLAQIAEGFRNHLFPPKEIEEKILEVSGERLAKCMGCPFNSTPAKINVYSKCKACGCFLIPKSKCLSCNCGLETYNKNHPHEEPLPLEWMAVLTDEEEDTILNNINTKQDEPDSGRDAENTPSN